MINAVLREKPYAGNPHVRFDEGEVASAKPRRGSLLYTRFSTALTLGLTCAAWTAVAQPEIRTDASRTSQLEKGTYAKPIVKVMRVPIRLDLASAADYVVYALDTAGRRTGEVKTEVRDGALVFVASTRGPDGQGCLAWEVLHK